MDVLEVVLKESSYGYGFALMERTIDVTPYETGFYIYDVLDKGNTDHSTTMLKAGDRLLAVNGVNINRMPADQIRDLLTQPCQGWICLTIQTQTPISNDTRTAILKNIPDFEKKNHPSLLKRSLKKIRRIFEQPKGKFTVAVKRNPKKTLAAQLLGGSEGQILNGYSGIHVLDIGDGDFKTVFGEETLQIGDRILSVNGFPLDGVPNYLVSDILCGRRAAAISDNKELEWIQEAANEIKDSSVDRDDFLLLEANRLSSLADDESCTDLNEVNPKDWCKDLLPTSPIAAEVLMIFSVSFLLSLI